MTLDILLPQIVNEVPRHLTSQIDVNHGCPRPLGREETSCLQRGRSRTQDMHAQLLEYSLHGCCDVPGILDDENGHAP